MNCQKGWKMEPRNCFLSHPTHCKIMYWADYLYTIYVRITFWSDSVSKKFNPPLQFFSEFIHWALYVRQSKSFSKYGHHLCVHILLNLLSYPLRCIFLLTGLSQTSELNSDYRANLGCGWQLWRDWGNSDRANCVHEPGTCTRCAVGDFWPRTPAHRSHPTPRPNPAAQSHLVRNAASPLPEKL